MSTKTAWTARYLDVLNNRLGVEAHATDDGHIRLSIGPIKRHDRDGH